MGGTRKALRVAARLVLGTLPAPLADLLNVTVSQNWVWFQLSHTTGLSLAERVDCVDHVAALLDAGPACYRQYSSGEGGSYELTVVRRGVEIMVFAPIMAAELVPAGTPPKVGEAA